jgi:hypothetical protein
LNNSIARFSVNRQPDEVSDRDRALAAFEAEYWAAEKKKEDDAPRP